MYLVDGHQEAAEDVPLVLDAAMPAVAQEDEAIQNQEERNGSGDKIPGVSLQKAGGFPSQCDAQPGCAEVAEGAGNEHHGDEFGKSRPGDPGTDDKKLERHRDGHEGRNEDRHHAVALEPLAEFGAAAFGGGLIHEAASAAMGGLEKDDVPNGGTRHGKTRAKPRHRRPLDGDQNEQRVEHTGDGDAGGIEYGEQKNTGRPPRDQGIG